MSRIRDNLRFQVQRLRKLELPVRAAALAYHSVLSVVPTFGLVFLYLNRIGLTREWRGHIEKFILSHMNVSASEVFVDTFRRLTTSVGGKSWGWLPLLFFLYAGFNMVRKSGDALDLVIDSAVEEPRFRPRYLGLFVRRLLVISTIPVAVTFSLVVSVWLRREKWFRELFELQGSASFLTTPTAWLTTILGLYLFYQFMPARPVSRWGALRAALVAGPALEIARIIVTEFSRRALAVQKLYGALAAIPILIFWAHIIWMIVLSAACLIRPKTPNQATQRYV